jgi:hypothetical protein
MTLFIDDTKNVISSPQKIKYKGNFIQDNFQNELQDFYKFLPWFKEKVNYIYISPLNENANQLILQKEILTIGGKKYFKPNKIYFKIQINADSKKQTKDIYTIVFKNVEYKLKVGIVTDRGVTLQNEEIFSAQEQYIKYWKNNNRHVEIQTFLESPVDESAILFFEFHLRRILNNANNDNDEENEKYIKKVIAVYEKYYKSKGKYFVDKSLDLLVYLNPKISLVRDPVFVERFRKKLYNPNILPFLTEAEKLEEIFNDRNVPSSTIDMVSDILLQQKKILNDEWITFVLVHKTAGGKKTVMKKIQKPKYVDLPSWRNVCKNVADLTDQQDENIVYIKEHDDVYGFTIQQMFDLIKNRDAKNPYTKVPIRQEFINRFLDTYSESVAKTAYQNNIKIMSSSISSVLNRNDTLKNQDEENQLVKLLENELCIIEKKCSFCKLHKFKKNINLESNETVLYFCSTNCLTQYSLKEFSNLNID